MDKVQATRSKAITKKMTDNAYSGPLCQDNKQGLVKIQIPPSWLAENAEGQVNFMSLSSSYPLCFCSLLLSDSLRLRSPKIDGSRGLIVQRLMYALVIVKLHIVSQLLTSFFRGGIVMHIHLLIFNGTPETLCENI